MRRRLCCLGQGAIVGLLAGLVMAFWVGIGSIVTNMRSGLSSTRRNVSSFSLPGNLTTVPTTTLLSSPTLSR